MSLSTAHLRVARPTNSIEALLPFYCDGLGFVELGRFSGHDGFDGVMLGLAERKERSEDMSRDGQVKRSEERIKENERSEDIKYHLEFTTKRGHDAGRAPTQDNLLVFYLPDTAAFEAATGRMRAAGIEPVAAFNPYWDGCGKTYEDADGYRVVLANRGSPV